MEEEIKAMAQDKIASAIRIMRNLPQPGAYVGSFSTSDRKIYEIYKVYGEGHYSLKHSGKVAYDITISKDGTVSRLTSVTPQSGGRRKTRRSHIRRRKTQRRRHH